MDLELSPYNLTAEQPAPPCGRRLGISYIRASEGCLKVAVGDSNLDICQGACSGLETVVWDCGLLMVDFLNSFKGLVECKRCLELGCGTGLVSLAAARIGAAHVIATDKVLCPSLTDNITRNICVSTVEVLSLEWGSDFKVGLSSPIFDVVLCSDVLYEPSAYEDLLGTLSSLSYKTGIIVYKIRNPREELEFFRTVASWAAIKVFNVASIVPQLLSEPELLGLRVVLIYPFSSA